MNKEQIVKKMELELYSLAVAKQYAIRHLNLVEYDIKNIQKIIEELKIGK